MGTIFISSLITVIAVVGYIYFRYQDKKEENLHKKVQNEKNNI